MKKIRRFLFGYSDRKRLQREVEEELQFHIEMQALDYEGEGLSPEQAFVKAGQRFGDPSAIRSQCIRIVFETNASARIVKLLFTMSLVAGLLIRGWSSGSREGQIGNMLIAIAILGGLLLIAKRMRPMHLAPDQESLSLGLENSNGPELPISRGL